MKWIQMPLGPLQTNAYILTNEQNECIIFDPGHEGEKLVIFTRRTIKATGCFINMLTLIILVLLMR